ncbi:MAG: hypothetical protein ACOZAR_03210 [Patescibacteria group bacterium]
MSISSLSGDFSQILRESRIEKNKEQQDTTDHAIFVNIFQNAFGVTDATILKRDFDSTDFGPDFFAVSKQKIREILEKKQKLDFTYKLLDFIQLYQETKFNHKIKKKSSLFNSTERVLFQKFFGFFFSDEKTWSFKEQINQLYGDNPGKKEKLNDILHRYISINNLFCSYFRAQGFSQSEIDEYFDYMERIPFLTQLDKAEDVIFFKLIKGLIEKIDSSEIVEKYLLDNPCDTAQVAIKDSLIRSN